MLGAGHRMSREQVERALRQGVLHRGPNLLLRSSISEDTNPAPRFAVVVSRKVAASSVVRNALRRRLYTALRHMLPRVKDRFHGVVMCTRGSSTQPFQKLHQELETLLKRAGGLRLS